MAWTLYLLVACLGLAVATSSVDDCTCGFYDSTNDHLFTESIIIYFNETDTIPSNQFVAESFVHGKELGWNALYRQAATPDNLQWGANDSSATALDLTIDPGTASHVVMGAGIRFLRQDILYGTFRTSMKSSPEGYGGSAMSMFLRENSSSSLEIDMCNGENLETARVTTLINGEYPSEDLGINYTVLAKGSEKYAAIDPWDYVRLQIDWTKKWSNFTVADNKTRAVPTSEETAPYDPLPFSFRHWSTGDADWMYGPPVYTNNASVAYIRAFFNSSLTTSAETAAFAKRCSISDACSVDDHSLRGASSYTAAALEKWHFVQSKAWRIPSAIVSGACCFIGIVTLINAFFRRFDFKRLTGNAGPKKAFVEPELSSPSPFAQTAMPKGHKKGLSHFSSTSSLTSMEKARGYDSGFTSPQDTAVNTAVNTPWGTGSRTPATMSRHNSEGDMTEFYKLMDKKDLADSPEKPMSTSFSNPALDAYRKSRGTWSTASTAIGTPRTPDDYRYSAARKSPMLPNVGTLYEDDQNVGLGISERKGMTIVNEREHGSENSSIHTNGDPFKDPVDPFRDPAKDPFRDPSRNPSREKLPLADVKPVAEVKTQEEQGPVLPPKKRVDYLAGLTVLACLGVTQIHFNLTFVPYAGGLTTDAHYKSEISARWWATPIFLDQIWLGPFFITSCRFLVERFLRTGDLKNLAQKTLLRAPRMLIPVLVVAFLEYFFIELGLTAKTEWLPATSWSTWVYVSNYPNFGYFLNEVLELAYLIPNKAPEIVSHYCVGVLWTVPVQLQFSFVTILAAVIVRDIKSPWKRFSFYAFVVVNYWYALNWGALFWLGLAMADLHVHYDWTNWVRARPLVHYPLITGLLIIALAGGPLFSLLDDRGIYPIMDNEYGIHPDIVTGRPISQTSNAGYPNYYEPRLNLIIFSVAMQMVVELSTWLQAFLSLPCFTALFPHTYTIYLFHGFVFWSIGSYTCVELFAAGVPYWACVFITFLVSYTCIAIGVILITPVTEVPAIASCKNIWRWAHDRPVPHMPTLMPFRRDLFLNRAGEDGPQDEESKGKGKELAHGPTEQHSEKSSSDDSQVREGLTRNQSFATFVNNDEYPDAITPLTPMSPAVPAPIQTHIGSHPHRPGIVAESRNVSTFNLEGTNPA